MWANLSEPWRVCLALSWESYCEGSIPIAAVISNADGVIVAQGRNRLNGQVASTPREIIGSPLAHAEINALLSLDYATINPHHLTLFTTVEPCPLCIGAICMAGLKRVHFAAQDGWAGSTNLLQASPYLRTKQVRVQGPDHERLETLVHMLQVACDFHQQHPRVNELLAAWRKDNRRNVQLGEQLYESGLLDQLRDRGASIETVVIRIMELMKA